ncbi:MAG TPA: hypothetical protein VN939_09780 [Chthoniobacterales bacterium]|nr:hypothetical protein [Chthoniobacterales bacterium]
MSWPVERLPTKTESQLTYSRRKPLKTRNDDVLIRPTSPNHNHERDSWNNREPAESFINIMSEVRTHAIIAALVNPAKSLGSDGNNRA